LELSGYKYNAITPFFMSNGDHMPIILAEEIANLDPAYLWFSGGRIEIKMGVSVADFCRYFGSRVIVSKIAYDK
jgi:prolyl-tRNA editing enzyme YbaK/EbsC (Cys-tRNA(Pro) deacylase)